MRTKDEILNGMMAMSGEIKDNDYRIERLNLHLIEVLIDIRDIINTIEDDLSTLSEYYAREM